MTRQNRLREFSRTKNKSHFGRFILFIFLIVIAATLAGGGLILFETEKPLVTVPKEVRFLGRNTSIPFRVTDKKSGIRSITITLEQQGESKPIRLYAKSFPRQSWFYGAGPTNFSGSVLFNSKKFKIKDGKAELVVTAHDFSLNRFFKGNETISRYAVLIDTKPPRISLQHTPRYIRPGGCGIVVYDLSESAVRQGVIVNGVFFQGFPLDGRKNRYISYVALTWNTKKLGNSMVVATDRAGNEAKDFFSMDLENVPLKKDRIYVSDAFLKRKMPKFKEHYPEMKGSLLDQYLFVNNEVRKINARQIKEVCSNPVPKQLWKDRFLRMNGETRAGFADQRTYFYHGQPVDHQVHLGMDIASTAHAAVKAANSGKVVMAEYMGIYGNAIILDHGQGVYSLYAHLSRFDVSPGEMVEKGEVIARSGATGMAGGDHLHFSMLIHGIFVTPLEWWDQHWIDMNINDVLNQL
ncbi:murein DD-endopeptidase MepM [bacterium BMS3Bbin14]|nr:murein DD-endopeptidase MepM [bacterium BMS3Abin13]GBE53569.1 murein DD-endopeptidase MepM [bacterium BMS3Bbin14]HDK44011.1 M23 family metallopeptidase [Desulfobacteraceae bacterium]